MYTLTSEAHNSLPRTPEQGKMPINEDEQRAPPINNNVVDFSQFLQTLQMYMQGGRNAAQAQVKTFEVIEQFRRTGPPRLEGCEGHEVTEEWIRELEQIF